MKAPTAAIRRQITTEIFNSGAIPGKKALAGQGKIINNWEESKQFITDYRRYKTQFKEGKPYTLLDIVINDRIKRLHKETEREFGYVLVIENYIILLIALCVNYERTERRQPYDKGNAEDALRFLLHIRQNRIPTEQTRVTVLNLLMCYSLNFELLHYIIQKYLQSIIDGVLSIDDQQKIKNSVSLSTCNVAKFRANYTIINDCKSNSTTIPLIQTILNFTNLNEFISAAYNLVCTTKTCSFYDLMLALMFFRPDDRMDTVDIGRKGLSLIKMQEDWNK